MPLDGVETLRRLLIRGLELSTQAAVEDTLRDALDIVNGDCAVHLRVRPARAGVEWRTVTDADCWHVVEFVPASDVGMVVATCPTPGSAELLRELLTERARGRAE